MDRNADVEARKVPRLPHNRWTRPQRSARNGSLGLACQPEKDQGRPWQEARAVEVAFEPLGEATDHFLFPESDNLDRHQLHLEEVTRLWASSSQRRLNWLWMAQKWRLLGAGVAHSTLHRIQIWPYPLTLLSQVHLGQLGRIARILSCRSRVRKLWHTRVHSWEA